MLDFILLIIIMSFVVVTFYVSGPSSAVSLFSLLSLLQAVTLYCVVLTGLTKTDLRIGNVYFSAMPMSGVGRYQTEVLSIFSLLCIIALFAAVAGRIIGGAAVGRPYATLIREAMSNKNTDALLTSPLSIFAIFTIYVLSVFHFFSMDHDLLWQNSRYLTIKSPDEIGIDNPVLTIYHYLIRIIGLVFIIIFELVIKTKKKLRAVIFLPIIVYSIFLMTAGNSRWIPLYFFAWFAARAILTGNLKLSSLILFIIGLFSFIVVINGRATGSFGVSQILLNIQSVSIKNIETYFFGIWVNIFEGGINISNSILIEPVFSNRYQWGSLSPFPSLIDGFDAFRDIDKFKFAVHVPMGGISEVIHFSFLPQLIFWIILFISLVSLDVVNRRYRSLPVLILNIFSCYVFYILTTYSIRTSFRYILAIIIVSLLINLWSRKSRFKYRSRAVFVPTRSSRTRSPIH